MTNYDLEEVKLLQKQMMLSGILIVTILISLSLSYNEILKLEDKKALYNENFEKSLLIFNRTVAFIVAFCFVYINYVNKNIKINYNKLSNLTNSNLQISASWLSVISAIIVLYVAIYGKSDITLENPEI